MPHSYDNAVIVRNLTQVTQEPCSGSISAWKLLFFKHNAADSPGLADVSSIGEGSCKAMQWVEGALLDEAQHPVLHAVDQRFYEALPFRDGGDLEHVVPLLVADARLGRMVREGVGRNLTYGSARPPEQGRRHHLHKAKHDC